MERSIVYWIRAEYRKNPPARIAQDASAADTLKAAMRRLGKRWQRRFDKLAVELAEYFAKTSQDRVDGALRDMLRRGGFTVRFKPTPAMRDAFDAVVADNAALIRSLPAQYLKSVEGDIMRSVMAGRDLGSLAKTMRETYGVTRRRAALIAKTQNNMATAAFSRQRHLDIGVTRARWLHSSGGVQPRPEHVAFSGKTYDIRKGAYLEGKWTLPGMEINCRCVSIPIIPGFEE